MDSDINNADNALHVEFYKIKEEGYMDVPFVRIHIPGDKTTVIDQPVREDHKERFVRQWLYFQMKNNEGAEVYGTALTKWNDELVYCRRYPCRKKYPCELNYKGDFHENNKSDYQRNALCLVWE